MNLNDTPVFTTRPAKGDVKRIRYYVEIEWDSRGIGDVAKDSVAELDLSVQNAGDTVLWGVGGLADLNYSLSAGAGVTAPAGGFVAAPGDPANLHTIS